MLATANLRRVLEHARGRTVFAESGYDGASVGRIAALSGVNKALINYHFGGKQGLFRAVITEFLEEAQTRMAPLRTQTGDPRERLRLFIRTMIGLLESYPAMPAIMVRKLTTQGEPIAEDLACRFLGVFAIVRGILEEGMTQGIFREVNPFFTHFSIISSLMFFRATEAARERLLGNSGQMPPQVTDFAAFGEYLENQILAGLHPHREVEP